MPAQSLNLLKDNFQEIYYAVNTSKDHSLVANPKGTRLYDSSRGYGRLWSWFYNLTGCCSNPPQERVKRAFLQTHTLFIQQLYLMEEHLKKYQAYLKKAAGGYPINEHDYFKTRKIITEWNTATSPFIRLSQQQNPKLEKLLRQCFSNDLSSHQLSQAFATNNVRLLKSCQKIIDLEGLTGGPLPLVSFKKVLKSKTLTSNDHKEIEKWVHKINKLPQAIHSVHKGIFALAEHFERKHHFVALEALLEEKGSTIFQQTDPKQIQWRKQLKRNDILPCNGKQVVLDSEVPPAEMEIENVRIFNIALQPQQVALIAQNRAALAIKAWKQKPESCFGIEPVRILDVSHDGRVAIMEKLNPLHSLAWTSKYGKLDPEDLVKAKGLADLIKWFIKQNHVPSHFHPSNLMVDGQQKIKSVQITQKRPFDFNALEDFAFKCAAGNLVVFQYLMEQSGLITHRIAKFYADMLSNSFKGETNDIDLMAGIYKIGDPKIVDRTKILIAEAQTLQRRLAAKIHASSSHQDLKSINKKVNAALLDYYKGTKTAGLFWPSSDGEFIANMKP